MRLAMAALPAVLLAPPLAAKPVLIAQTPGHTQFFVDDATVQDLPSADGPIRQAHISTRSAPDPHLRAGQVAAEGVMQFRCAQRQYRQMQTTSINLDGSRRTAVPPSTTRAFVQTAPGRFENTVLDAVCRLKP
jgi:hypothetical protein